MRILPNVQTLREAVGQVVDSNSSDGYTPTRFIQATGGGDSPALLFVCERLIEKGETLEYLERALIEHSQLLTLEDFVVRYGANWGFSPLTIEIAEARVKYFDQISGGKRYT